MSIGLYKEAKTLGLVKHVFLQPYTFGKLTKPQRSNKETKAKLSKKKKKTNKLFGIFMIPFFNFACTFTSFLDLEVVFLLMYPPVKYKSHLFKPHRCSLYVTKASFIKG